ncbi:hypothetical protein PDE01_32410 [Paracoccus denitrificans]|nr:hypothetical protein PDE01_32410 [Paracoccus denitrificans]
MLKRWEANVDERSIKGRVVCNNDVSFSELRYYTLVVKGTSREVCVCKPSKQGQSWRHRPARIFAPRAGMLHLDDPAPRIDAQPFDRNFHKPIRGRVQPCRFRIDNSDNPHFGGSRGEFIHLSGKT